MIIELIAAVSADSIQQAVLEHKPEGLIDWAVRMVQQLVTVNVAWVIVSLLVGLIFAVGATEFSKRYESLYRGEHWALKAQLFAAMCGAVVTTLLIWFLTDWPESGRTVACLTIAPLAAFYAHRAYDALRDLFPHFMARASQKLRGDQNCDVSPP